MSRYSSRDSDRDRGRGGGGGDPDTKLYVGDLARDAHERDLERAFSYYGRLRNVWVARNPAGFAFVEFEDPRDADDAVRALDGTNLCGSRIRVEHSTGKVRPKPWLRGGRGPPGGGRDGGDRGGGGGGGRGGERSGGGGSRDGGAGGRKPFDPADRCYECGDRGHYAYDCSRYRGKDRARKSSSYSKRSRSRSYSRSRSRSHSRGKARSYSRSRSRSPVARSKSRSPSP